MKKLVALLVALVLLSSSAFALTAEEVLAKHSQFPLIPEGETSPTITISAAMDGTYLANAEDLWLYNWLEKYSGIDLEVTMLDQGANSENKQLMMASGDLPDVMLYMQFSTSDLVYYGTGEGMLLDFTPYITPEIMPNLCALMENYDSVKAAINGCKTADGKIYTLPAVYTPDVGALRPGCFINKALLEKTGLDMPTNLDEFIAMLYAMKEADPECIPLGGSNACIGFPAILNALGFLSDYNNIGTSPSLRKGEIVIPGGQDEWYQYLSIMRDLYRDGIVTDEIFTQDFNALNALLAEGKLGVYPYLPTATTVFSPESPELDNYIAMTPLTSEWNDTPAAINWCSFTLGNFVCSGSTENAELICRLFDFAYSIVGWDIMSNGPIEGVDDLMNREGGVVFYHDEEDEGKPRSKWPDAYSNQHQWMSSIGGSFAGWVVGNANYLLPGDLLLENWDYTIANDRARNERAYEYGVYTDEDIQWSVDRGKIGSMDKSRASLRDNVLPYGVEFIWNFFFDTETSERISELNENIPGYIRSESAKFISGQEELTEEAFAAYIAELKDMGFDELQSYYNDFYQMTVSD